MTPRDLLAGLLTRHERAVARGTAGSKAIGVSCPRPGTLEEREDLSRALAAAERAEGVSLAYERGATHLVDRIVLKDPAALYAHLGIEPAINRQGRLLATFDRAFEPKTSEAREAMGLLREGVAGGRTVFGIAPEDTDRAIETVRVIDAVYGRDPADRAPLRAFSTSHFGNSKLIGRSWRRVCQVLRQLDLAQDEESETDDDIAQRLGICRSLPLVCISGPLTADGLDLRALPLAGLTEGVAVSLLPAGEVASVLVVENWESFRRHVDEVRRPDEVVVYSGGWPSLAVQATLKALAGRLRCPFHHWGDIDPAGVRIAQAIGDLVGGVMPHLMSVDLVQAAGTDPRKPGRPVRLREGSPFRDLAAYLDAPGALILEQEVLNPFPVVR